MRLELRHPGARLTRAQKSDEKAPKKSRNLIEKLRKGEARVRSPMGTKRGITTQGTITRKKNEEGGQAVDAALKQCHLVKDNKRIHPRGGTANSVSSSRETSVNRRTK